MDETLYGDEPARMIAGDRLRAAREAAKMSLADVAARTRIPLRQLEAVEQGRYEVLPSPTYAVGFAKAYARAVGGDEVAVAAEVRDEIARVGARQPEYQPYELPDPARVPSRGLVIAAAGAALAVLILVGLWYGTSLFRGGAAAPAPEPSIAAAAPTPAATATPVPTGGLVRLTAKARVWLRVYDADDKTLYLGTMNEGDHFDVPADAKGPMINVGRPDMLQVTLDGRATPPLGAGDHAIKDVKVDGASIAARLAAPPPGATPTPTGTPSSAVAPTRVSHREAPARPARRPRNETARANLEAARNPPTAGNGAP